MNSIPEARTIEWTRSDGVQKKAGVIPIQFPTEGLSQEQLAVIDLLSQAVNWITPMYAQQHDRRVIPTFHACEDLERRMQDPKLRQQVSDFNDIFATMNSFWLYTGQGIRHPLAFDQIPADHPIKNVPEFFSDIRAPPTRALYPHDITEEEFKALGDIGPSAIHSSIIRLPDGSLKVVKNEERFRPELARIIAPLERALQISTSAQLNNYIRELIGQLKTGSDESEKAVFNAWMANKDKIDLILGTGMETYFDRFQGRLGTAMGAVFMRSEKYESLNQTIANLFTELEARAPWRYKKNLEQGALPRFTYIDSITRAGYYDLFFPLVVAQSFSSDVAGQDAGTVNFIFANAMEALKDSPTGKMLNEEYFVRAEVEKHGDLISRMGIINSQVHESGHALGDSRNDARAYFGTEYNILEELRAELLTLWAYGVMNEKGILTHDEERAGYYQVIRQSLRSLAQEPKDHFGAWNILFHYMIKNGALLAVEEDGRTKYALHSDQNRVRSVVEKAVTDIGNMRLGPGDLEGFLKFKAEYLRDDPEERKHFSDRNKNIPEGVIFICPVLEKVGEKYTGGLVYPASVRNHPKTLRRTATQLTSQQPSL